jgi:LysR family transcriptional regulator for bpeEF and oprC
MDQLQRLRVFARVAETASFTRTAEQLGVPKPTVTLAIQELESRLNVRLLYRTTRRVSLTDEGRAYYERCTRILEDLEEADALFTKRLKGTVRLDLPERLAALTVIPALPKFVRDYPDLKVIISATDKFTDLIDSGVDVIVRVGALTDSTMTVRRVGFVEQTNVASREYVDRYGVPKTLDELKDHVTVGFHSGTGQHDHDFEYSGGGFTRYIPMRGTVSVTSSIAYHAACRAGLGIIQAPRHGMVGELRAGDFVELLTDYRPAPMPVSILHAQGRKLAPRIKALIDWLAAALVPVS